MQTTTHTKNEIVTIAVTSLGSSGEGVATLDDGMKIFVPFALVGETVEVIIVAVKKSFCFGKIVKIIHSSKDRILPKCDAFGKCGGCQLQHLNYEKQLQFKRDDVVNSLKKFGGFCCGDSDDSDKSFVINLCVPSPNIYCYRNKIQLPVGIDKCGKTVVGFFRANSHDIIPINSCPLHGTWATLLIDVFLKFCADSKLRGYNYLDNTGDIRHLVARQIDNKILVCVVTTKDCKILPKLAEELQVAFKNNYKFSLLQNINTSASNIILGKTTKTLFGDNKISLEFDIVKPADVNIYEDEPIFEDIQLLMNKSICADIQIESFLQVNFEIAKRLYRDALDSCDIDKGSIVIDAYSGAGIMSALFARNAKKVFAVEICKEASMDADKLTRKNSITNIENINGDCADILPKLVDRINKDRQDKDKLVIILDPPRKGCDKPVLDAVTAACPDRIIYISCDPSTLARDLKMLCFNQNKLNDCSISIAGSGNITEKIGYLCGESGHVCEKSGNVDVKKAVYSIQSVTPYDMFPQTCHVETLVVLSKNN